MLHGVWLCHLYTIWWTIIFFILWYLRVHLHTRTFRIYQWWDRVVYFYLWWDLGSIHWRNHIIYHLCLLFHRCIRFYLSRRWSGIILLCLRHRSCLGLWGEGLGFGFIGLCLVFCWLLVGLRSQGLIRFFIRASCRRHQGFGHRYIGRICCRELELWIMRIIWSRLDIWWIWCLVFGGRDLQGCRKLQWLVFIVFKWIPACRVWSRLQYPSIFWFIHLFFILRNQIQLHWRRTWEWGIRWRRHMSWFIGYRPCWLLRWRIWIINFSFVQRRHRSRVQIECNVRMMVSSIQ